MITDQFKSPTAVKDTPSFIQDKCPQQQNGELLKLIWIISLVYNLNLCIDIL